MPQFGLIRQATRAFNVACVEQDDYEADDLIATYAQQAAGDRRHRAHRLLRQGSDAARRPGIRLYDTMKDKEIGEAEVFEKFGVEARQGHRCSGAWPAIRSTMCRACRASASRPAPSSSPNIGDLETLLTRAPEIKQQKRRENLIQFAEQARISKQLVTLESNVPVEHALNSFPGRGSARSPISSASARRWSSHP